MDVYMQSVFLSLCIIATGISGVTNPCTGNNGEIVFHHWQDFFHPHLVRVFFWGQGFYVTKTKRWDDFLHHRGECFWKRLSGEIFQGRFIPGIYFLHSGSGKTFPRKWTVMRSNLQILLKKHQFCPRTAYLQTVVFGTNIMLGFLTYSRLFRGDATNGRFTLLPSSMAIPLSVRSSITVMINTY